MKVIIFSLCLLPVYCLAQNIPIEFVRPELKNVFHLCSEEIKSQLILEDYSPSDTDKACLKYFKIDKKIANKSVLLFNKFNPYKSFIGFNTNNNVCFLLFILDIPTEVLKSELNNIFKEETSRFISPLGSINSQKQNEISLVWSFQDYNVIMLHQFYMGKNVVLITNKKSEEYLFPIENTFN